MATYTYRKRAGVVPWKVQLVMPGQPLTEAAWQPKPGQPVDGQPKPMNTSKGVSEGLLWHVFSKIV